MKLVLKFNILFFFLIFFSNGYTNANEEPLEIIKERQILMSSVQKISQKIYKIIKIKKSSNELIDYATLLEDKALLFMNLFPENSKGGESSSNVWSENDLFLEYQRNFIIDIKKFKETVVYNDLDDTYEAFNTMMSNCGTCHKKFKD